MAKVILGVTGSVAAIRTPELYAELKRMKCPRITECVGKNEMIFLWWLHQQEVLEAKRAEAAFLSECLILAALLRRPTMKHSRCNEFQFLGFHILLCGFYSVLGRATLIDHDLN